MSKVSQPKAMTALSHEYRQLLICIMRLADLFCKFCSLSERPSLWVFQIS